MSWHDPTDPKEHLSRAKGRALLTATEWQCAWTDSRGNAHQREALHREGFSMSSSLIQHVGLLSLADFPAHATLYLPIADFVLAPSDYAEHAAELLHKVFDETIPELAVGSWQLAWPKRSCLVAQVQPSFQRVWKSVARQGKVMPLVERDIAWLFNNKEQRDLVMVHLLPGSFQVSIKKAHKLQLCNSFRYREPEEALMMLQSVLAQFFTHDPSAIHIAHAGKTETETAAFLCENLEHASLMALGENYWFSS